MINTFSRFLIVLWSFLSITAALHAQSETKYSYFPKNIYKNQVFPVTVIILGAENGETFSFSFDKNSGIKPLFEMPLMIENGHDKFYTFYFKAKDKGIRIPELTIVSGEHQSILPSDYIPLSQLSPQKDFSGVLAADMKIITSQVSNYDEKNHIVTLSIEANEANLEDMKLNHVIESGMEDIQRENAKARGELYAVVPETQKELTFSYFNTISNQYVTLSVPVEVRDATVVAHSDLNPKEDSFEELKKYTLLFFSGFFLLLFLFKRDFFYLVLGAVSFITLLTLFIPHKKICIKQGAPLYILPTHTSTVSTYVDKEFETVLLGERDPYFKIEYKEGVIGWIKHEDVCKN